MTGRFSFSSALRAGQWRIWLVGVLTISISWGALGQIRTDSSLGQAATTLTGPNFLIQQNLGKLSGSNLFHSFETFNILTGQSANFTTTTAGLANVISRVTGGSLSQINGQLRLTPVSGAPNFFFINPAGVTFGGSASINVPGAFHVSTANYIRFPDGNFHANLNQGSSFSSASPEAFGFLGTTRASVTVRDNARLAQSGTKPISIVGGDIAITNNGAVTTAAGDIRIVAVGQAATEIGLTAALPPVSGNLSLLNRGIVSSTTTSALDAGSVSVAAGNITVDGVGGAVGIFSEANGGTGRAGAVDVLATGNISVTRNSFIFSDTSTSANAGNVSVTAAGNLTVSNNSSVSASTFSSGNTGTVKVSAQNITVDGPTAAAIYSDTATGTTGKAGNVEVSAKGNVLVTRGSFISSDTRGSGNAGNVAVTAAGNLSVTNRGAISSSAVASGNTGSVKVSAQNVTVDGTLSSSSTAISTKTVTGSTARAGDVEVSATGNISVIGGGSISSQTRSPGSAGNVNLSAGGNISVATGGFVASDTFSSGNAGKVEVLATGDLSVTTSGVIGSDAFPSSSGDAGAVKVSAGTILVGGGTFLVDGGSISSRAHPSSQGRAGTIEVLAAGALSLTQGGVISSITDSPGNGGNVNVHAGSIAIDGTDSFAQTGILSRTNQFNSTGNAGSVDVSTTGSLSIIGGGEITSSTFSAGRAGSVKVDAGSITIDGGRGEGIFFLPSLISSSTSSAGHAGSIEVSATGDLSLLKGGTISSDSFSSGSAGSVRVGADTIVLDKGYVSSGAYGSGNAGNVEVSATGKLSIYDGYIASIIANFSSGNGGSVKVSADSIAINRRNGAAQTGIFSETALGSTGKGGSIEVSATGNLSLTNSGVISSTTFSSENAGSIKVNAGSIDIDRQGSGFGGTGIFSLATPDGTGSAGSVEISATGRIAIVNGGEISTDTFSTGNAGAVKVSAGSIVVDGQQETRFQTGILSQAGDISTGNAGNVEVSATGHLSITSSGTISSSTFSSGDAGSVNVIAGSIAIDGQGSNFGTGIFTQTFSGTTAKGGNIDVSTAGNLSITSGGNISSSTFSSGNAGSVKVSAGSIAIDGSNSPFFTGISSAADPGSFGNAGSVEVSATRSVSVSRGGISSSTLAAGNAGSVKVSAGIIDIDGRGMATGIFSAAEAGSTGRGGSVQVSTTGDLAIREAGIISSSTFGPGDAGSVQVSAANIAIDGRGNENTGIRSEAFAGSTGNAGTVNVSATGNVSIADLGQISSATYSSGNAGSATVSARSIDIDGRGVTAGISSAAYEGSAGNAGRVDVTASSQLSILNGGEISSSTFSEGNAGSVNVSAGSIVIDGRGSGIYTGISSQSSPDSTGNAGSATVASSGGISVLNGGAISSTTFSPGDAGSVKVDAVSLLIDGQGSPFFTGISSQAARGSTGKAGSVDVATGGSLSVLNGGQISSGTFSSGPGGPVRVSAGSILIDRGSSDVTGISSEAHAGTGNAGSVEVAVAGSLSVLNGGDINSSTFSAGNAGSVKVSAGSIVVDGHGSPFFTGIASQAVEGSGNAGSVEVIATGSLSVLNGGVISSGTDTQGNGGSVMVSADSIVIDGQRSPTFTGITSQAGPGSTGKAGSVSVAATGALSVLNGGRISSDALFNSAGNAGNVEVSTGGLLSLVNGGSISSGTFSPGAAGSVIVTAGTVSVDGATSSINASAAAGSSGQTGSVSVSATDSITLSNAGSISIQNDATVADPGKIVPTTLTVSAPDITLKDAQITAASTGNVPASDVQINFTNQLFLDPSSITTSANLGNGGSITIQGGQFITLENSQIITSVLGLTGNGGNISIHADRLFLRTGFIQANTAGPNATGGLVNIDVRNLLATGGSLFLGGDVPFLFQSGVFGFNVIQAAAPTGVSGVVQLTNPILDLSGSLAGFNVQVIDTGGLGRSVCQIPGGSSLARVGRGGLPPAAGGLLRAEAVGGPDEVAGKTKPVSLALRLPSPIPACF